MDRAPASGAGGRRFESCRAHQLTPPLESRGPLLLIAEAVYGAGRWPINEDLLEELAARHGLEPERFSAEINSESVTEALAESSRDAFERGAFGVPTFFIGARMFWGNDRLPLVYHALTTPREV